MTILPVGLIGGLHGLVFTVAGQDAPVIHAGEEWPFLSWGLGHGVFKRLFVQLISFFDISLNS